MTAVIGRGLAAGVPLPSDPVILQYDFGGAGVQPAVRIGAVEGTSDDADLLFLFVARAGAASASAAATRRPEDAAGYHLPTELRTIALRCATAHARRAAQRYRLAKSLELLCETVRMWAEGDAGAARARGRSELRRHPPARSTRAG